VVEACGMWNHPVGMRRDTDLGGMDHGDRIRVTGIGNDGSSPPGGRGSRDLADVVNDVD
jgi:hypothetical protein